MKDSISRFEQPGQGSPHLETFASSRGVHELSDEENGRAPVGYREPIGNDTRID